MRGALTPLAGAAALLVAACSSAPPTSLPSPTSSTGSIATATSSPTVPATPTPPATATPAPAAISLTCPSVSEVSADFATPFTVDTGAGYNAFGGALPAGATDSQCGFDDYSIAAFIYIVLVNHYPAGDMTLAEQHLAEPWGQPAPAQTPGPFSQVPGLGDQAVSYDYRFTIVNGGGTDYAFGTIATHGSNLVSVQGLGNTFTPDQSMFDTLIDSLLS